MSIAKIWKDKITPALPSFSAEEILVRAHSLFHAEESDDLRDVIAEKTAELRHYDVLGMERVLAIVCWGRSGSLLLSSYLDGHDDVMMLPELCGFRLYEFFERYPMLPLRDKLIAYPAFDPQFVRFFEGDFSISPAQYYASVQALLEFYEKWPAEFLESRRAFFLFVHVAYAMALGARPSARPLIVHALHEWDDALASKLVEDFPQAKFVHTIRDPLSSCNGMFRFVLGTLAEKAPRSYVLAPYWGFACLTNKDRPHSGMESRTRTIRFEDLHGNTAETMRDLSDWLGLPYRGSLLDSTFNSIPFVAKRDGKVWSGSRSEQVRRDSRNLSPTDRALLFAVFYENFVKWNYPCPRIFRHGLVRCIVFVSLLALPTKMEVIAARRGFRIWILPLVRQGDISRAIKSLLGIAVYRVMIMQLLAGVFFRRLAFQTTLLPVEHKVRPLERRDDSAQVPAAESTVE